MVAVVATCSRTNAVLSRIDLADLSKYRPRWKLSFSSRAGVNIRVRRDFLGIVNFSKIDGLRAALLLRIPVLAKSRNNPFWQKTTEITE